MSLLTVPFWNSQASREFACSYVVKADHEVEIGPMRGACSLSSVPSRRLCRLKSMGGPTTEHVVID